MLMIVIITNRIYKTILLELHFSNYKMELETINKILKNHVVDLYFKEMEEGEKIVLLVDGLKDIREAHSGQNHKIYKIRGVSMSDIPRLLICKDELIDYSTYYVTFDKAFGKALWNYKKLNGSIDELYDNQLILEVTKRAPRLTAVKIQLY